MSSSEIHPQPSGKASKGGRAGNGSGERAEPRLGDLGAAGMGERPRFLTHIPTTPSGPGERKTL